MKTKYSIILLLCAVTLVVLVRWFTIEPSIKLLKVPFHSLPGWEKGDVSQSLQAFKTSCRPFLKFSANKSVGSVFLPLHAGDWQPVCRQALLLEQPSPDQAKQFFERNFTPLLLTEDHKKPKKGLFTGYYMPLLHGSYNKSKRYFLPLYAPPKNRVTIDLNLFDSSLHKKHVGLVKNHRVVPMPDRAEINEGVLGNSSPVIVWVDDRIDRFFLEIQGSGVVQMDSGEKLYLGYAAGNGKPYTPAGKVLLDKGAFSKKNMSMQAIRQYIKKHPEEMDEILHQNKSFIFFNRLKQNAALGSQGVSLTPGYSLAVDRKWLSMGIPLWLNTTRPRQENPDTFIPFQRLMIAQDTGGAIKGAVRGDVFWGEGAFATRIAGHMKNTGTYWLLLPNKAAHRVLNV